MYGQLQYAQNRTKQHAENYEDIYDRTCYSSMRLPGGELADENTFTLTWYTDGLQVFKSSKKQVWPLCFTINELPYSKRVKPENILLAGLWFAVQKPVPEIFF